MQNTRLPLKELRAGLESCLSKADSAPFTYSPDLNPVDEAFAKLEALLRRAAARSHEALVESMGAALDAINTQDAHAAPLGPAEEVRQ